MRMSEKINELATALSKAQGEFPAIHKNKRTLIPGRNEYWYADLSEIIKTVQSTLTQNGLSVCQMVDVHPSGGFVLTTRIMHVSGQWLEGAMPLGDGKMRPQEMGSLLTYYRRYAYVSAIGIQADDDDDGAHAEDKAKDKVESFKHLPKPSAIATPKNTDIKTQMETIKVRLKEELGLDAKHTTAFIAEKTKKHSLAEITQSDINTLHLAIDDQISNGWDVDVDPVLPMGGVHK